MAGNRQKLELTWIGKDERPRLEPRILLEDPTFSYHAPKRVTDHDIFDNILIHGDNLLALKALEQEFAGTIKCIYIDPPFNTGQALEHYDDGIEHSIWLGLMRDRIEVLRGLLSDDGSIFVHIDDNELGYLIVLMDEVFGRNNRISIITFKQSSVSGPKAQNPGIVTTTNFILYYARSKPHWRPNRAYVPIKRDARYGTYISDYEKGHKEWKFVPLRTALAQHHHIPASELRKEFGDDLETEYESFVLAHPERVIQLARVQQKDVNQEAKEKLRASENTPGRVFRAQREGLPDYYFMNGKQILFYSSKTQLIDGKHVTGQALSTQWDDLLSNNIHQEGGVFFPKGKKPEALIKRILDLSTSTGDWVLDSFAGSGTSGAVAHKMHRRWIMVELRDHCDTHIYPRMRSVLNGSDTSGVTAATGWKGGGGFRYFRLAPSLLKKDQWGNWVINKTYNAAMLAESVCRLEGFRYEPDADNFWIHGRSTETDYLYVTTQNLSHEQLQFISDQVGPERTLLICCGAFRAKRNDFPNLTLKKIPQAVLNRCEWGRDDYSLNVQALPLATAVEAQDEAPADGQGAGAGEDGAANGGQTPAPRRRKKATSVQELPLFEAPSEPDKTGETSR